MLAFFRQDLVLYVMTGGYKVQNISKEKKQISGFKFHPLHITG